MDSFLFWWFRLDLNQRHKALQASALPTELQNHIPYYNTDFEFWGNYLLLRPESKYILT